MGSTPYRKEYLDKRKSVFTRLLGVVIVAVVVLIFLFSRAAKNRSVLDASYVGKVVQIEGSFRDIGVVLRYQEGKYIELKSAASDFQRVVYYRLGGNYALKIMADSIAEYRTNLPVTKKGDERQTPAGNVASENAGQELSGSAEQSQVEATGNPAEEAQQPALPADAKNENEEAQRQFEQALRALAENEIKDLDGQWQQFVNACLINSDSKKYLAGRKWFQFYEDVARQAPDVSAVDRIKYYDDPACVSCEEKIFSLLEKVLGKLLAAEEACSKAVTSSAMEKMERRRGIDRKEWANLKPQKVPKEKNVRAATIDNIR